VSFDLQNISNRIYCRHLKIVKLEDIALESKTGVLFLLSDTALAIDDDDEILLRSINLRSHKIKKDPLTTQR